LEESDDKEDEINWLKCQLPVLTAQVGTQLTCFTGTKVQILTKKALLGDMEAETNSVMLVGATKHASRY
jgi:hypothetical protein